MLRTLYNSFVLGLLHCILRLLARSIAYFVSADFACLSPFQYLQIGLRVRLSQNRLREWRYILKRCIHAGLALSLKELQTIQDKITRLQRQTLSQCRQSTW